MNTFIKKINSIKDKLENEKGKFDFFALIELPDLISSLPAARLAYDLTVSFHRIQTSPYN